MRNFFRLVFAIVLTGLLGASSVYPSAAAGPTPYDGVWSVQIMTLRGDCDATFRYPLRIVGGYVVKADNDPNYRVAGRVGHGGAIGVTVSGGGRTATGHGRLTRTLGRGVWHTSTGQCSGQWSAQRRS
jgi:hypothetical protein